MATVQVETEGQQQVSAPAQKIDPLPAFDPVYQNMMYPNIFSTGHLAPGTYFSAADQTYSETDEDLSRRRLSSLGITLLLSGTLSVLLGLFIVLLSTWYIHFIIVVGAPWWTGFLSSVAGMLAIGARAQSNNPMTIASLLLNTISGLACLPAVVLYAMSIDFFSCFWFFCFAIHSERMISVLLIFLLLNSLVSLIVSIIVATINCKRLRCCTSKPPMTMIVVQPPPPVPQEAIYATVGPREQPPAYCATQPAIYNVPV